MRIAANADSPHFHPASMHATVTLDGVKLTRCLEADDVAGTVTCYGPFDPATSTYPLITRRGIVRLSFPADKATAFPGFPPIPEKYLTRAKPAPAGILRTR